jgi:hypothetical protein
VSARTGVTRGTRARGLVWLALGLLLCSLAMIAFILVSAVLPDDGMLPGRPSAGFIVTVLAVLTTFPVVGAIVAILRPGNPIGWLFLAIGLAFTLAIFAGEYVGRVMYTALDLPGASLVAWAGTWSFVLALGLVLTVALLVFPDGRLPSPRWRPVLWASWATIAIAAIATALAPGTFEEYTGSFDHPIGLGGAPAAVADLAAGLSFPALAILGLLSLASLIVRFRRSRGVERQQLKWFLLAGSIALVGGLAASVTMLEVTWYLAWFGLASLPIAAGIAILRYRLYDIDRIISRTVSYAVLSALLGLTFAGGVLGVQALLGSFTEGDTLAVAASTLVVFALFQPLRRRIQRAVDRRFNRARVDAEATSTRFAERLRDEVDLPTIKAELTGAASEAVAPTWVGAWVRRTDGGRTGGR